MNEPQSIDSGKGMLMNNYPSAAQEALKRKLLREKQKHIGLDAEDLEPNEGD